MDPEKLPKLSANMESLIKDHLLVLHKAISERAQQLALKADSENGTSGSGQPNVTPVHCLQAIQEMAPGELAGSVVEQPVTFWHQFANSISAVTLISAALTIIFGLFGVLVIMHPAVSCGQGAGLERPR